MVPRSLGQKDQQLLALLRRERSKDLFVPVKEDLVADGEGLLPFLAQLQPVGPARLFLGHKAVLYQLGNAALRIPPVQPQRLGQLAWTAARMLAHIEDQEQ